MRPLEPGDLFSLTLVGSIASGPDGKIYYAASRPEKDTDSEASRIMVLEEGEGPRPFTAGPKDRSPALSPDGSLLAFLSARSGTPQVWAMATGGGEPRQITRLGHGVAAFRWAPDGKALAVLTEVVEDRLETEDEVKAERPPEERYTADVRVYSSRMYKFDGEGFFGRGTRQVVLVDARTGEASLLTTGRGHVTDLAWAADGSAVRFITHRLDDRDVDVGEIWEVAPSGGPPKLLFADPGLSAEALHAVPRGPEALFLGRKPAAQGYDNPRLHLLVPGAAPRPLGGGLDRPVGNLSAGDLIPPPGPEVVWPEEGEGPLAVVSVDGTTQVALLPADGGDARMLTAGDHVVTGFAVWGGDLVLALQTPSVPSDLFRQTEDGLIRLTDVNRDLLTEVAVAPVHRLTARAAGGPGVDAWWIEPPEHPAGEALPGVLEIHGGPMAMYSRAFMFEHQLIAAQGIAVVASNPRGSQGYGEAFCAAIRPAWGEGDFEDLMAVADAALREIPALDAGRLGVAGGSYGGFMTNWIAGHTDRFRAAHTMRSVVDWRAMAGTSDVYWDWTRRFGTPPFEDDALIRQQSPITYVDRITMPFLIEHQEGDLRCPIEQGEMLYAALKVLDRAPAVFVRYPGEFHGMSRTGRPWHRVHRLQLIRAWWRHHLLGEPPDGALKTHLASP